jgi:hypothetical protein
MTCAGHQRDFVLHIRDKASTTGGDAVADKAGVLWRIFDLIIEPRQKETDRDIARSLAQSGGRLTDDIERETTQRFLTGNWNR